MSSHDDKPQDPLQTLWQKQPTEIKTMSAAEIQTLARKFQSKIYHRNIREYALSALGAAFFCFAIVKSPDPWMKAACLLILAGLAVYVFILHTRGRADREGPAAVGADCRHFHIDALTRQKKLIGSVWLWGIMPVLPGLLLFMGRRLVLAPAQALPLMLAADAFAILVLIGVAVLNLWAAQRLQKKIDAWPAETADQR
jgi:hypothetical protein